MFTRLCRDLSAVARRQKSLQPPRFWWSPFAQLGGFWLTCSCLQTEHLTLLPHLSRLSEKQGPLQSSAVIGSWLPRPLDWFRLLHRPKLHGNLEESSEEKRSLFAGACKGRLEYLVWSFLYYCLMIPIIIIIKKKNRSLQLFHTKYAQ